MKAKEIREEMEIPEGVEASIEGRSFTAKGQKGQCQRMFTAPKVKIEINGREVAVFAKDASKRDKTNVGTCASHITNMLKGVKEGFVYKLKICSGHFPMNVSMSGNEITVKNFLGEKSPRSIKIKEGASVKIEGSIITVESCNKEIAGQTAADIERLTRVTDRDKRVFQDGIYITEMAGKPIR